ncbi:NAD(P)H-binding protein [Amycolatopsis sp. FDAARGOS 1241]|uniref:NAD(P)H-binding protein n=1 Tax=Amycolatopsis sp. FDAARGOS 1241 TaxID=2778070 RepID=UPI00194E829A|nr:NAD(P)H-binding protein [Amycolatopsis sp. FDAARGOS 1241]QRP47566.1 NAD(P)H-binding protein [Amycolatopsis sp. FDAARGOS 1241]
MSIVITGATGQLGRLVIADLLAAGVPASEIAAVARSAEKAADLGVREHTGDYDQPETLAAGDRVLLVSGTEPGHRVGQHAAVIDAAKAAGVAQLAYTGAFGGPDADFLLADDHRATERLVLASGLPLHAAAQHWYSELAVPDPAGALALGAVVNSVPADARIATAPREDYAKAAAVLLRTDGHLGLAYELSGDHAWTYCEYAEALATAGGRPVEHRTIPGAEYEAVLTSAGVPAPMATILADIDVDVAIGHGRLAGTPGHLSKLLGHPTTPIAATIAKLIA